MEAYLISATSVDWEKFVTMSNKFLGRSPTRNLDSQNIPVGSIASYLASLDSFNQANSNPRRPNEFTLEHVSLTFLVVIYKEDYLKLVEQIHNKLKIIRCVDYVSNYDIAAVITGNLSEWKQCVLSVNVEDFYHTMWATFHMLNLGFIFSDYKINDKNRIEKR